MSTEDTREIQLAPEEQPTRERVRAHGNGAVPQAAAPAAGQPPLPVQGLELLGQLDGSGFEETPYLVRRPDGQVVQLPGVLYALVALIDGRRDAAAIGEELSAKIGKGIDADGVAFLVDEKLRPLGVVGEPDGSQPEVEKKDDLLGLTVRAKVIPPRVVHAVTTLFKPLFWPPVVVAVVGGLIALDLWLFLSHGVAQSIRGVIYQPALLLALFGAVVVATAWHEVGHATACRYGGGKPGALGVGIYVVWPVMFSDVTDAYRLERGARLRTDLGGVYFNAIFALAVAGAYAATGYEPLLLLVLIQNFAILQQLLPLGRLDGYLVLSDLTGVPDLLNRLGPILKSALPWRRNDPQVEDLKPWVRRVATGYVLLLVPVLLAIVAVMLMHAPRLFATAYDSLGVQWDKVSGGFADDGAITDGLGGLLHLFALLAPVLGAAVTTVRLSRRAGGAAASWSAGDPGRSASLYVLVAAGLAFLAFTWWPNGEYRPIQPAERGTLSAAAKSFRDIPSGRPALTQQRQAELQGAPNVRDANAEQDPREGEGQTDTSTTNTEEATTEETTTTEEATVPTETTDTVTETTPTETTPTTTDTTPTTTPTTP